MTIMWPKASVESHKMDVKEEWRDYNGHLNMAYYNVLFDEACDRILAKLGLGAEYLKTRNGSYFTAEAHVCYVRELEIGMPVITRLHLLDLDAKRIRVYQELFHAEEGWLSATSEQLCLHVDMNTRKVVPWPEDILSELTALQEAQRDLAVPERAGRGIAIKRRPT